ncbi:unnamed protein product [Parajaminaea phylloscopi]
MALTSFEDPYGRPGQRRVSLRQELAKLYGTKHFQIARDSMAPLPRPSDPASSASSAPSSPASSSGHAFSHAHEDDFDLEDYLTPRGRSPTPRRLGAFPANREQTLHEKRPTHQPVEQTSAWAQVSRSTDTQPTKARPAKPVHAAKQDAGLAATTTHFERPPESTSLLPILARPPVATIVPTALELGAMNAEEDYEGGEFTYLSPAHVDSIIKSGRHVHTPAVLYTRSHLPDLDLPSRHLWHALHDFRSVTDDYAAGYAQSVVDEAPHPLPPLSDAAACPFAPSQRREWQAKADADAISSAFNWSSLHLPEDVEGSWFGVAFRSIRRPGSESIDLYEADRRSHEEAVSSGGLLLYWYGTPSATTGENLATCIWTTREAAVKASALPDHAKAVLHSIPAYAKFDLSRYRLVKVRGETGLRVEAWHPAA